MYIYIYTSDKIQWVSTKEWNSDIPVKTEQGARSEKRVPVLTCQTSLHHFQTVLRQRPFRIGSCFFICRWDWWCRIGLASRANSAHTSAPTYRVRHQIWGVVKTYITLNTKCCEILNMWLDEYTPYFGFQRPGFGSLATKEWNRDVPVRKGRGRSLELRSRWVPSISVHHALMPGLPQGGALMNLSLDLGGLGWTWGAKGGHRLGNRGGSIFWLNKRHTVITSNDTYWISRGIDKTKKWTH